MLIVFVVVIQDVSELDTDNVAYNILNLAGKEEKPLIVDLSLESRVSTSILLLAVILECAGFMSNAYLGINV